MKQQTQRGTLSPWGMEVSMFCLQRSMTKKQLAEDAGVPYDSLMKAIRGKRAGHITKEAVAKVMATYGEVGA